MAYTVLARRYRSSTFDEVVGQEHVAQTLKKAIASGRIAHAYLFNGTRGVGKTSMARILAKALNCLSFDQPTPDPCNKCDSCKAIARGDDIDVIEIDAASNTSVDNVRDVIENAQYRPARARFKVYIIDEAHMLSKSAFNALLKTLEEPPSHVKFILATTEPEKILPTILSRCQRYDFRNIPTREIAGHLREICKQEKIAAAEDALLLVAKAGAGSMRDSLSLLDRLLSIGQTELTADMIEQLLGLPKSQLVYELAGAVAAGDVKSTLTRVDAIVRSGFSVDSLISALTDHLRNLLIIRTCGADSELVEVPGLALSELASQAEHFDTVVLSQDIALLDELRRSIRQSQAGRALLDATLVRLALADQVSSISQLLGQVSRADTSAAAGRASTRPTPPASEKKKPDEPAVTQPVRTEPIAIVAAPPQADPPTPIAASVAAPAASAAEDEDDDLPRPGKVWEGPSLKDLYKAQSATAIPAPVGDADESNVAAVNPADLPGVWRAMLGLVAKHGPGLHGLMSLGRLIAVDSQRAVIRYSTQHEMLVKAFDKNGKKDQIRDAMAQVLKRAVGVEFEFVQPDSTADAPSSAQPANGPTRPAPPPRRPEPVPARHAVSPQAAPPVRVTPELTQSICESVPLVRSLMENLNATIIRVE